MRDLLHTEFVALLNRADITQAGFAGLRPETATPEKRLAADLLLDSLDLAELAMCLEEDFDFDVPDADAEELNTVQDVIDYVDGRLARP